MRTKAIGVTLGLLFAGYLFYASLSQDQFRCEVCIDFRGQTACRTASGATRDEAKRTAVETACAVLASGRTESMNCTKTEPTRVRFDP